MGERVRNTARAYMNTQMRRAGLRYNQRQGNRGIGMRRNSNAGNGGDKS